jgi:hypothetical protein
MSTHEQKIEKERDSLVKAHLEKIRRKINLLSPVARTTQMANSIEKTTQYPDMKSSWINPFRVPSSEAVSTIPSQNIV